MKLAINTAVVVQVNLVPLIDSTDFKTIETGVLFNAAGLVLYWNFTATNGTVTKTAVVPTSGGTYDWIDNGDGMYAIEIPASGGASINNDTAGTGYFSGSATGILPWIGPRIDFVPQNVLDSLISGTDLLQIDLKQIDNDATSLTDFKDFIDNNYDPITHHILNVMIVDSTVALGGLPPMPTDWITAAGVSAGAVTKIQFGLATQADVLAINQSASRRIIITTVAQYERPEAGNSTYTIEARTYTDDGAVVNADSTPTLTATGIVSGNLAANLSAATNPATGVYRWTYTVSSVAVIEQIQFEVSATISTETFTLPVYTQVADFVAATFTTTDRATLNAIPSAAQNATAVRTELSVELAFIDASISSRGVALDAVGIRASIGLANPNLDTQLIPVARFATMIELDGAVYRFTTNALEQAPSGSLTIAAIWNEILSGYVIPGSAGFILNSLSGGSAGVGAFVITLTIEDENNDPMEGVYVSLHRAGDSRHGVTNVNGVVVFNSNAVTWTDVAIYSYSHTFTTAPLVITANTAVTYVGTPNVPILPALGANQVHVQAYTFNELGTLEDGVVISWKMIQPSTLNGIFDDSVAEFTSVGGIVVATNRFQGATYQVWRGRSQPMSYKVPIVAVGVTSVNMNPLLGNDANDPCL